VPVPAGMRHLGVWRSRSAAENSQPLWTPLKRWSRGEMSTTSLTNLNSSRWIRCHYQPV